MFVANMKNRLIAIYNALKLLQNKIGVENKVICSSLKIYRNQVSCDAV